MKRTYKNLVARLVICGIIATAGFLVAVARSQDVPADFPVGDAEQPEAVDPAVEALLLTNPTTPGEIVRLARVLVELDAAASAKPLIDQLVAAPPDAETMADLVDRFGSATFLQFKMLPALNPEATQLADAVLAAARQRAADPRRIEELIGRLSHPDRDERRAAIELLRSGRSVAVVALLRVLADPRRAAEHPHVRDALAAQGQEAVGPLLAALTARDSTLKAQAADVLGRLRQTDVSDYLLAPALAPDETPLVRATARMALENLTGRVPRPTEAAAQLYQHAHQSYDGQLAATSPPDLARAAVEMPETVEVWTWSEAERQPVAQQLPAATAVLYQALRLAGGARRLTPDDSSIRRLYLGASLELALLATGDEGALIAGGGPAVELAVAEGLGAVTDLLVQSMASGHVNAAVAAAALSGRMGDSELLHQAGSTPSPLVEAMRNESPRLRFAAVAAVMEIDPERPYAGSSYLPKALTHFVTSAGRPRALVAAVHAQEAQRQAGILTELGYDTESVYATADIQRVAARSADFELLLIDLSMAWPGSGELIQRLRRDGKTARLPIAVVAGHDEQLQAARLARRFALVEPIIRPPDPAALEFQIAPLLARRGRDDVGAAVRLHQASVAISWAERLSGEEAGVSRRRLYDLSDLDGPLIAALWTPQLSAQSAVVLAQLGRPTGQKALVDLASRRSQPIELRQAGLAAFEQGVRRHGILLTSAEMLLQYDRYNQSELLDKQTQTILGSILDVLEAPSSP